MTTQTSNDNLQLLRDIRDNQLQQLEKQSQALEMQKQQFALYKQQFDKAEQLQHRAESSQERSKELVDKGRKIFTFIIPILFVLLAYVSWLLFFR